MSEAPGIAISSGRLRGWTMKANQGAVAMKLMRTPPAGGRENSDHAHGRHHHHRAGEGDVTDLSAHVLGPTDHEGRLVHRHRRLPLLQYRQRVLQTGGDATVSAAARAGPQ